MTPEEFVGRLERVKRSGKGWMARCPAHEDKTASLSIGEGDDSRVLLRCFAGCSAEEIVAALVSGSRICSWGEGGLASLRVRLQRCNSLPPGVAARSPNTHRQRVCRFPSSSRWVLQRSATWVLQLFASRT